MLQLRNEMHAEDCVREALAQQSRAPTASQAIHRCARLIGILKHRSSTIFAGRVASSRRL